jgi:DNA-binding CsgD family transcriptional regulator
MARLGAAESSEFCALRSLCYAGLSSAALRERLARRLRKTLRVDAFCLMELDPNVVLPVHGVSDPWTAEDYRVLAERVILASPAADPARLHQSGRRTVNVDEVALDPSRDPYFEYHLLPRGYRHELLTLCRAGGEPLALLTFTRTPGRGAFEPRHIRLLDSLAPHVAAGIRAASVREAALAGAQASTGLVALGVDGEVELTNAAGEEWLRKHHEAPGRLPTALRMVAAVAAADPTDTMIHRVPVMQTRDPETGALYVLRAEQAAARSGRPRTLVLIEPVRTADQPRALLQLGLTPREAAVAVGMLQGRRADEIACDLGCAPQTVRVHLRNIFEKLGVNSRRELGALLIWGTDPRP